MGGEQGFLLGLQILFLVGRSEGFFLPIFFQINYFFLLFY